MLPASCQIYFLFPPKKVTGIIMFVHEAVFCKDEDKHFRPPNSGGASVSQKTPNATSPTAHPTPPPDQSHWKTMGEQEEAVKACTFPCGVHKTKQN